TDDCCNASSLARRAVPPVDRTAVPERHMVAPVVHPRRPELLGFLESAFRLRISTPRRGCGDGWGCTAADRHFSCSPRSWQQDTYLVGHCSNRRPLGSRTPRP